jgi:hypothetical protein
VRGKRKPVHPVIHRERDCQPLLPPQDDPRDFTARHLGDPIPGDMRRLVEPSMPSERVAWNKGLGEWAQK